MCTIFTISLLYSPTAFRSPIPLRHNHPRTKARWKELNCLTTQIFGIMDKDLEFLNGCSNEQLQMLADSIAFDDHVRYS